MKKSLLALALIAAAGVAQAGTVFQSQEYAYTAGTATNWGAVPGGNPASVSLTFDAFDTTLGTLDSVVIKFLGSVTSSVTVNAVTAEPFGADVSSGARIRIIGGPGTGTQLTITKSETTAPLSAGTSAVVDFGTLLADTTFNAATNLFLSDVTFDLAAVGSNSCGTSGGNNGCDFNTTAGARIEVTYDYTATPPAKVPEPASMALVGLGMMGLAAIRRRK
ncbi:choice-of-anchor E domain-containing protein [Zoogloea sp.]|uniref:choice-of-anchor E domain-containing protein n=1 Tax=Zoogloea sp. TaxID=49181 RepID=UPI0035B15EE5